MNFVIRHSSFVILLAALAAHAQPADSNLTVRLQIELTAATPAAALTFSNLARVALPDSERLDPENKSSPTEVRAEGDGQIRILGTFILRDYTAATNIARALSLGNPGVTGRIHVHLCPLEGSIKDWAGCDADRRARPIEFKL